MPAITLAKLTGNCGGKVVGSPYLKLMLSRITASAVAAAAKTRLYLHIGFEDFFLLVKVCGTAMFYTGLLWLIVRGLKADMIIR
jgi:hypothetical protein